MKSLMVAIVWLVAVGAISVGCGGEEEPAPPSQTQAAAPSPVAGGAPPTRGSVSPVTEESGGALLTRAFDNMEALPGLSAQQVVVSRAQGITITLEQATIFEAPDKVYIATSLLGNKTEVFVQGESVFVREAGGDWALSSALALGLDPEDLFSTVDVTALASSIEVVGEVDEDGRRLIEILARLDSDAYYDEIVNLLLRNTELARSDLRIEDVEVHYFVDSGKELIVRGSAELEVVSDGVEIRVTTDFAYKEVGTPVKFPAGLPEPGSAGQAGRAGDALDGGKGCGTAEQRTARLLALLGHVPARPDTVSAIYYDDYECARAFLNVSLPEGAPAAELLEYRDALVDGAHVFEETGHVAGFSTYFEPEAWEREVGFNVNSVDQLMHAGVPPRQQVVLRGRFDPASIGAAVMSGPASAEDVETVEFSPDIAYFSWGEDGRQNLRNRTAFRPLGRAGRLVPGTEFLLWAHTSADIESMIAASVDGLPSLGDVPEFGALAGAFGEVGGYSVTISASSNSLAMADLNDIVTEAYGEEAMDALRASGILHPYLLLAVGIGQDSAELYSILLYVNPDPGSAQANAIILDSILADGVSLHYGDAWSNHIDRFEVSVSGSVTRAKIWSSDPTLGLSSYNNLDSLVLSE